MSDDDIVVRADYLAEVGSGFSRKHPSSHAMKRGRIHSGRGSGGKVGCGAAVGLDLPLVITGGGIEVQRVLGAEHGVSAPRVAGRGPFRRSLGREAAGMKRRPRCRRASCAAAQDGYAPARAGYSRRGPCARTTATAASACARSEDDAHDFSRNRIARSRDREQSISGR